MRMIAILCIIQIKNNLKKKKIQKNNLQVSIKILMKIKKIIIVGVVVVIIVTLNTIIKKTKKIK